MKTVYYVASSLDGYIADSNHGVDWLDELGIKHDSVGYEEFFSKVDGLLMGRKSYDFVYNFGKWPYEDRPTWICTKSELPQMEGCNLQSEREPERAIESAKRQGISTLWVVGGGSLVGSLIKKQLLTHLCVSVMPILLGKGIPLVDVLSEPVFLHQESSQRMSGFTQIEYRVDA